MITIGTLRVNNVLVGMSLICGLYGCAHSSYRVFNQDERRNEILVSPDRVLTECQEASKEEDTYGFIMHVLDDQNTVLGVIQGNATDKESCIKKMTAINRILLRGRSIYVGGMGDLERPRLMDKEYVHDFPRHGKFFGNGRVLQFMVIQNERGECYAAYSGAQKPCPRDEFPITDTPWYNSF